MPIVEQLYCWVNGSSFQITDSQRIDEKNAALERFSEVVNEATYGANRVVLTRHEKNVAAVVPIADLELLNGLERIIDVEEAHKALMEAQTGSITLEELKKKLGG